MRQLMRKFLACEHGGSAIEYSLIAVLISIAGVAALMLIGPAVMTMFTDAGGAF
ncbi:Flp family type IVb pilin [Maricaulis sp.]|uniref:Flp family type IVb pilin n=1 Tax=unclassified Maricaulis TaxID=2632371 RepID=UPI001B00AE03|nr:Flp family type IVb pilin [Maricaulis sp.]MBO6797414.1 Flp family type IVb pilin [Maricaulis sp.]